MQEQMRLNGLKFLRITTWVYKISVLAEGVGFEPTVTRRATTAFETAPFVRSGNLP